MIEIKKIVGNKGAEIILNEVAVTLDQYMRKVPITFVLISARDAGSRTNSCLEIKGSRETLRETVYLMMKHKPELRKQVSDLIMDLDETIERLDRDEAVQQAHN